MTSRYYYRIDVPGRGIQEKDSDKAIVNDSAPEPKDDREYGIDGETIEILEDDQVQTGG